MTLTPSVGSVALGAVLACSLVETVFLLSRGVTGTTSFRNSAATLPDLKPLQLGQAFLRRGERVGTLLRAEDSDVSYQLPRGVAASDAARASTALETLSAKNPHYRLNRDASGVLKLKPKKPAKCAVYLGDPISSLTVDAPISDALVSIIRQHNPDIPDVPVGVIAKGTAQDSQPFFQKVRYSFQGGTLEQALDALILAASDVGWLIIERPPLPEHDVLESYCVATTFSTTGTLTGFSLRP